MPGLTASAPGKLVVAGEYAVVDGARAIVMAVDRRAWATTAAPSTEPGVSVPDLLRAVCDELQMDVPSRTLMLDSAAFFTTDSSGQRRKLGLGSSAALTAALCRMLMPRETSRDRFLETALAAHRRFQSGLGSGLDVAASVAGGLLSYCMRGAAVEPLPWPARLCWAAWWSGKSASTVASLERLARAGDSAARSVLVETADNVAAAWARDPDSAALPALANFVEALLEFDATYRLGIFEAGHGKLVSRAPEYGVVYKPCGAGGGDVGIAVADDIAALEAFATVAKAQGFRRLDLAIDPDGARLHGRTA